MAKVRVPVTRSVYNFFRSRWELKVVRIDWIDEEKLKASDSDSLKSK